ncbi:MAG: 4Fe-4S binding protein [Pseudodesulfovibrio sp.]|uniref:NIL domain protein n=1 Tax=Pseudodesulfovibrio aespoeensis (strain ATCC 700646 / DSM 10631 / Aspo-2) TaxID=643562 RepID=E6VYG2_PSEA9|nr:MULTISPECIES: NIL domain-containing protein [Pseudodesulfovibrio]MBU4378858.1 4Fe-4S binding protein [Pseudomonadota bacterium]ADU62725.1 NIL domain protein [Pseudodesulfovibrio aespoeensis Aspo-2]MBU4476282.1 4Fe-4S binding protein [Pseudomonadota bacterium]MBU4515662.1 4Fe-4S binding protein [Pseudomonadota bacterium]MBU4523395.1 4Fe-4S binding protein [Pseudomonadota bacterium]
MKELVKGFRKIVYLSFPPEVSGRPVVCNLTRLFDLSFNILKADISPRHEGTMTLEVSGLEEDFHKGIGYLKENGIRITPVAHKIFRNEESCIHCGVCTAMCPTDALLLDPGTRLVVFDVDKCSACGMCTRVCPVKAMTLDLKDDRN